MLEFLTPASTAATSLDNSRATAPRQSDDSSLSAGPLEAVAACCDVCGRPAAVFVLDRYLRGQPRLLRFCCPCRSQAHFGPAGAEEEAPRIRLSSLLALVGLVFALIGLFGDFLVLPSRPGFGLFQGGGVLLGILVFFIGGLLRADLVALGGLLLAGTAVFADVLGVTRGPGLGYKQELLVACGLTAAGVGLAARFRSLLADPWAQRTSAAASAARRREPARADLL